MNKSKKQFKLLEIPYGLNWLHGTKISKIRDDLDAIEKLGATHVDIDSDIHYGRTRTKIKAISERIETDDEYKERLAKEEYILEKFATIQAKEDREYCQFTIKTAMLCSVSPNCYYCKYKPKVK